jgi:dephospho-CoA kinase
MMVIGLTGSIGMGKSTAARMLRRLGVPVFEADHEVHALLGPKGRAVADVAARFPDVVAEGGIDRCRLAEKVFSDERARRDLEAILHPMVRAAEWRFLKAAAMRRAKVAVLDLPLLFETGADRLCDVTVVVTAPAFLQEARVLRRMRMTHQRFESIRASQMSDAEKRRRADFVVPTGAGLGTTLNRLRRIVTLAVAVEDSRGRPARTWLRMERVLRRQGGGRS